MVFKKLIYFVTFNLLAVSGAVAEDYVKAEIYYHDWGLDVRSRMTMSDVRSRYLTKLEIRDKDMVRQFVDDLPIHKLSQGEVDMNREDVRLVIDLTKTDGKVDTYLASRFVFFDSNGEFFAKLPKEFSEKFSLGYTVSSY